MSKSLVPYDVAYGSQGLWLMIQSTKRKMQPTIQQRLRDYSQSLEHSKATIIYVKHDPSYRCSCSFCRI